MDIDREAQGGGINGLIRVNDPGRRPVQEEVPAESMAATCANGF